ncbi:hypothetical protein E2C01_009256 [Portunus trituberculatus]|uniref:Uncharacterized protein n=1 Tax=Portunus trituberculatus TaxID=210409 RepID=A0A5B7D5R0_PORTR|nr:hypothetical protein [Portunus trituberculatus]
MRLRMFVRPLPGVYTHCYWLRWSRRGTGSRARRRQVICRRKQNAFALRMRQLSCPLIAVP